MTELEYRDVAIRSVDTESRTISGIAVPYGQTIDVGGFKERFEKGDHAFEPDAALFFGHDHRQGGMPIGRVIDSEDTDEGVLVRARISETAKGEEVYRLAKDGVLKRFSVGFEPLEHRLEDDVVVRTKTRFKEVSVTPFPAYAGAMVAEVRSAITNEKKEKEMTETVVTTEDVADLRDTVTDLERRIAVMTEERENTHTTSQFRSAGEILKALAAGDEAAKAEFRDFGTMADADVTRPAWIQRPLQFVQEKRPVINLFQRAPLPPMGNSVEYPVVARTEGTVQRQVNEGDALAYMEVALGTETATVGTYGGYSSLSRQAIERSDQAYLDAVLRFQAIQYAKSTNAVVQNAFLSATGVNEVTVGGTGAVEWVTAIVDGIGEVEDNSLGLMPDVFVVSRDVYRTLVTLHDGSRPLFDLNGDGQNTYGNARIPGQSFSIAGVPGVMVPGLPAGTAALVSREALTVLELPGAPFRLQDESIINLTKDFSLYGYLAVTVNDAKGIVRFTLPA